MLMLMLMLIRILVQVLFVEMTIFDMDKWQSFNQLEKHLDIVNICLLFAVCYLLFAVLLMLISILILILIGYLGKSFVR
jgi:hypothetical protein